MKLVPRNSFVHQTTYIGGHHKYYEQAEHNRGEDFLHNKAISFRITCKLNRQNTEFRNQF